MDDLFSQALSPFRNLDVGVLYQNHQQFIDGVLFFFLFFAFAQAIFGKKLQGRLGKTVSVVLSLMLTIGFMMFEKRIGFSLSSLGVVSFFFAIIALGFLLYAFPRFMGWDSVTSFSVVYTILYLSLKELTPNLFDYIELKLVVLNGILSIIWIITFCISIYKVIRFIFPVKKGLPKDIPVISNSKKYVESEDNELKSIHQARLKVRTIIDMMDALSQIEKIIQKGEMDETAVAKVKAHLHDMATKENIFMQSYNELSLNFRKLGIVDSDRLHTLETEFLDSPDNKKSIKQAEIDIEKRKIEYDAKIIEAKSTLKKYIQAFNESMQKAMHTLSHDDIHNSKSILLDLKRHCDRIEHMIREVMDLGKMQKGLFKTESKKRF